jgi:O-6-methylguanine DNA methyltransferase
MKYEDIIGAKNISASPFYKKIYFMVAQIPKGRVASYGDVAKALGKPNAARAVGTAMARNQDTDHVPCHRVVKSDGTVGFYAGGPTGSPKKMEILKTEGIEFIKNTQKINNFHLFRFRNFKKPK